MLSLRAGAQELALDSSLNPYNSLCRSRFWREDVRWHGVGTPVDMSHDSRSLAFFLSGSSQSDADIYVMINAYWEDLTFTIQEAAGAGEWRRVIDTSLESPEDFCAPGAEVPLTSIDYVVRGRSIVVMVRTER